MQIEIGDLCDLVGEVEINKARNDSANAQRRAIRFRDSGLDFDLLTVFKSICLMRISLLTGNYMNER